MAGEPFPTYTTSTMPGLLDNGAYEDPGTNISTLCFSGSTRRNSNPYKSSTYVLSPTLLILNLNYDKSYWGFNSIAFVNTIKVMLKLMDEAYWT